MWCCSDYFDLVSVHLCDSNRCRVLRARGISREIYKHIIKTRDKREGTQQGEGAVTPEIDRGHARSTTPEYDECSALWRLDVRHKHAQNHRSERHKANASLFLCEQSVRYSIPAFSCSTVSCVVVSSLNATYVLAFRLVLCPPDNTSPVGSSGSNTYKPSQPTNE